MTINARFQFQRCAFALDGGISVPSHGVTAIFGPSGCGKTSLLRLIAGLDHDSSGSISIDNQVWQDKSTLVPTHERAVGFVFQEATLFRHLSVRRNLEFGYKRVATTDRSVTFDQAVDMLGLHALLNRKITGLSGGERQRIAIAQTLLTSPRLLLMDEPLTGLDADSKAEIIPTLERLHESLKIPVLYVSHSLDEVARLADHIVLMDHGRVVDAGPFIKMVNTLDSPLSRMADAESIIEATVDSHDGEYKLTQLAFSGGILSTAGNALPVGHPVRVRIMARDVSLALHKPTGTSILNILPATIVSIREDQPGRIMVQLNLNANNNSNVDTHILSRITHKSASVLDIAPGKNLFAQVKSVALIGPYHQPKL